MSLENISMDADALNILAGQKELLEKL